MNNVPFELLKKARPETRPGIPRKLRLRSRIFGKQIETEYLWKYYEREAELRVPFYIPCIYMKEIFSYLRRFAGIPSKQISAVLIDDEDARTDAFLCEFLGKLNYLTIITSRKKYFESLQERAFQELGLLIDLIYPWEAEHLNGNLVWDFTETMQSAECYPKGSICFMPCKKSWKIKELMRCCEEITAVTMESVTVENYLLSIPMAEAMLVPKHFPFRISRCQALEKWCNKEKWAVKIRAQKGENLDI